MAYQLGDIHENSDRPESAIGEYETALTLNPGDLTAELHFRIGNCRETLGDEDSAVAAYKNAVDTRNHSNAFRLSALARCAAIYETKNEFKKAIAAYRDLVENADDPELIVAARARVEELEAVVK